jgi:hypothetical protein
MESETIYIWSYYQSTTLLFAAPSLPAPAVTVVRQRSRTLTPLVLDHERLVASPEPAVDDEVDGDVPTGLMRVLTPLGLRSRAGSESRRVEVVHRPPPRPHQLGSFVGRRANGHLRKVYH